MLLLFLAAELDDGKKADQLAATRKYHAAAAAIGSEKQFREMELKEYEKAASSC